MNQKKQYQAEDNKVRLDYYHSPTQFRFDGWHRLSEYSEKLHRRQQRHQDLDDVHEKTAYLLRILRTVEEYTAYPSAFIMDTISQLFEERNYSALSKCVANIVWDLTSGNFRRQRLGKRSPLEQRPKDQSKDKSEEKSQNSADQKPYFEVLIIDKNAHSEIDTLREGFEKAARPEDAFTYDIVAVRSFEDALIAILFNYNIQACVIRYEFPLRSKNHLDILDRYTRTINEVDYDEMDDTGHGPLLGKFLKQLRPELDLYLVTDESVESIAGSTSDTFRRIFYRHDDYLELHLNLLRGINRRYETPFFNALRRYSQNPTGVFHAMPISRGKSVTKSNWIRDMVDFYGINIFLAETSATSGGLDSLLQPHGPIKRAQEFAARAFGARRTYFVTNGTSTANKIVVQALVKPRDIVLIDRDCHKSHHYGLVLAGAHVSYLDSYPLHPFSMYGAVSISTIKRYLLTYKEEGRLDQVKMLLLTNCTFDGVVYNVQRVMEECLAIKPDLIFLWDEAWFAFAGFTPTYRQRTAMASARKLSQKYRSVAYREAYEEQQKELGENPSIDKLLNTQLLPDPDKVAIRVYATQSTHKSLTSLRQGSMIHVYDQLFKQKVAEPFDEAFMTHTSTSPNYQILASLDLGRRQAELEGYELVQKQLELAMSIREQVATNPRLSRHFRFLIAKDLIPEEYRQSGIESYFDSDTKWMNTHMETAWESDEFVVDPTRLTLYLGDTGIDGDTFKNEYLMDKYGIQINKTSRNTVLFMTNIGTTRSSVAFLIEVLTKIADELEQEQEEFGSAERRLHQKRVKSLTQDLPPLPDFSRFHEAFRPNRKYDAPDGDIRKAYYLSYDEENYEYLEIGNGELEKQIDQGKVLVSAGFVIPYPPGFPILVPGQVISSDIITFMRKLDVKEIHGYQPELGLTVFTEDALKAANTE
ncbi:MAG: aminotransferase class I/II-fold pyridoxal phosphate-dependent enzyme [Acidiferrobacterales bacterium]|nr:aminotransferase class I/II-fold pyridoxal phosphate-dependent enzyme [Acidiferrobacterales bacterium]